MNLSRIDAYTYRDPVGCVWTRRTSGYPFTCSQCGRDARGGFICRDDNTMNVCVECIRVDASYEHSEDPTAVLSAAEMERLQVVKARAYREQFTSAEVSHLQFTRWLYRSGRVQP